MPLIRPLAAALSASFALIACGSAPPASPASSPAPPPPEGRGPRLRASGEDLYVSAPSDRYARGELLYVLSPDPVPGTSTHPRIGLVQVTEPDPVKVSWVCQPKQAALAALGVGGLPVEGRVKPDATVRVGKCWGRYLGQDAAGWKGGAIVDLTLNLGEGDGVKEGDLFEVLGQPNTDLDNRTVTGFERLGVCAVQPFEGSIDRSVCRLDRYSWPKFSDQWWTRGGFVRLAQSAP